MNKIRVTHHAADRARERFGIHSRDRVRRAWREGVRIPRRLGDRIARKNRRSERWIQYRIFGSQLLIGRENTVITTWPIADEDLASVFVYALMGVWT
ncbi:MAG TPA: hypothetical protein QGF58_09935 [Myxococcota bacterium]|nr:hypothetical protein [Myxococcota bacterium]